jgi:predicted MPP superfamily phosphohydrolase
MSIRTLEYSVAPDSVTPNTTQWGGMQYEDNATEIIFFIDEEYHSRLKELNTNLLYRIDFNSSAGGYDPSENLTEDNLRREIPYKFTCNGGNMTATLVVTATDENGSNTNTVLSQSVLIGIESVPRNAESAKVVCENLSAMEYKLRKDLEEGKFQGPQGPQGPQGIQGPQGDDYVLTEEDKKEIAGLVEGGNVDLTGYVQYTDYATNEKAGLVRATNGLQMVGANKDGIGIAKATNEQIDGKAENYNPIVPANLDYAVKMALADSKLADTVNAWNDEEKAAARGLLDAVGGTDYANDTKGGVVKVHHNNGLYMQSSGDISVYRARDIDITTKTTDEGKYRPICPANLDLAVKVGVTTNTIPLTDEEKTAAQKWLGVDIGDIETALDSIIAIQNSLNVVPDYVTTEAKAVADKVIANRTANSLVLLMGADIHVSPVETVRTAIKHMGQGMNEIRNYITPDAVILLGDYNYGLTPMSKEQGIEDMKLCRKYVSDATKGITTIWLNGNHDYYTVSNSTPEYRISDDMVYALVGSNTTNTVVDTQNVGRNYGYIDFEKQKIRLIYLNTTDINGVDYTSHLISTAQLQWFKEIALDLSKKADEENWGVVVCSHIPLFDNTNASTILGNFVDKTNDYENVKANLICVFHGHIHNFKVTEKQTDGGNTIKYICIPNAVPNRENPYTTKDYQELNENGEPVSYPKTQGTAEETSFNTVIIDKDNKAIHAICYGAGYDRLIEYGIAEEPEEEIINQIPISTDLNGAIYGGDYDGDGVNDGYKQDTRIGSDGADRTGATGKCATGFIPITPGDILYFSNCELLKTETDINNKIVCYNADKAYVGAVYMDTISPEYYTFTVDENNNLIMLNTTGIHAGTAYVRISANYIGADSIITINQEIRE